VLAIGDEKQTAATDSIPLDPNHNSTHKPALTARRETVLAEEIAAGPHSAAAIWFHPKQQKVELV
jgi:hypothetical protein